MQYNLGNILICIKNIIIPWTSQIMLSGNKYKIIECLYKWNEPAWKLTLVTEKTINNTSHRTDGDFYLSEKEINKNFINLQKLRKEKLEQICQKYS